MRFFYLKLAVLAGALAANGFADAARMLVAPSYTSDRDEAPNLRAVRTQALAGVDGEERGVLPFADFAANVLKSNKPSDDLIGKKNIMAVVRLYQKKESASQILSDQELDRVSGDLLANKAWVRWAYFVCISSDSLRPRNNHLALIDVMLAKFGYNGLTDKLVKAAKHSNSKAFAETLIQTLIEERYIRNLQPEILIKLLRINLKMANLFESRQFDILSLYLSHQDGNSYAVNPYISELIAFDKCFGIANVLKMLLSSGYAKNYRSIKYQETLKKAWLNEKIPPSTIVSMLALDQAQDYRFLNLETNRPSVEFWVDYWIEYCYKIRDNKETLMETLINGLGPRAETVLKAAKSAEDETTKHLALMIESSTP